jgi:hypothetical protein
MISEFEQWLRSRTNQEKRPFHEETVLAYAKAARALDAWMTEKKINGDFTACDTALLNGFFRDYHAAHTRGGTNTKQRNLRHLFTWLEADYDHPQPRQLQPPASASARPKAAPCWRPPPGRCGGTPYHRVRQDVAGQYDREPGGRIR